MKRRIGIALSLVFVLALTGAAFVPDVAAVSQLSQPVAVSPADFQQLTNVPRNTMLAWDQVPNAASYLVTLEYSATGEKGTYSAIGSPLPAVVTELTLSGTTIVTKDGYYMWTVQAVSGDLSKYTDSNQSVPAFFEYSTTKTLATPTMLSPANHTHFKGLGPSPSITLAWDSRPGVTTNGKDAYAVTVEVLNSSTGVWENAITTDPALVIEPWQNSSLTFTPTEATGSFRWAVQALGDGSLAKDSPAPDPTKPNQWYYFFIQ